MNEKTMTNWLRNVFWIAAGERPCALILDGYGAHWTDEVVKVAEELGIRLALFQCRLTAHMSSSRSTLASSAR